MQNTHINFHDFFHLKKTSNDVNEIDTTYGLKEKLSVKCASLQLK